MSTPPQEPRGNWGPIVALSHHPTFCGLKNEKYLSSFDVWALVEPLRRSRSDWWASHLFVRLSERVNDKKHICQGIFCVLRLSWAYLYTASNNVTFSSRAKANTSAGFMWQRPWAAGRWQQLLSANLPVDIVAVLADRQPGLVGGQIPSVSRLSFPIKPFHLNVQSTPWQDPKKITRIRH